MRQHDLAIVVLQHKRPCPLQHAERATLLEPGRMLTGFDAAPAAFDADHPDAPVVEKRVEQPD